MNPVIEKIPSIKFHIIKALLFIVDNDSLTVEICNYAGPAPGSFYSFKIAGNAGREKTLSLNKYT